MNGDASGPGGDDDARFVLSFEGSEVGRVHAAGDTLHIVFSAARVRERPGPGMATGREGHVRSLEMRLEHAAPWPDALGEFIGGLSHGRIETGGRTVSPMPLPCHIDTPCRVELGFLGDSALSVSARSVSLGFTGEPRFCEDLSC
jgi:hypothetical protein